MLIIGIDPGISGSICFFEDGKILDVVEMPTMTEGKKNKKQVNGSQLYNEISNRIKQRDKKEIKVVIEQVSAMPGQGVTSMFNFGQTFGAIKGVCAALGLPIFDRCHANGCHTHVSDSCVRQTDLVQRVFTPS